VDPQHDELGQPPLLLPGSTLCSSPQAPGVPTQAFSTHGRVLADLPQTLRIDLQDNLLLIESDSHSLRVATSPSGQRTVLEAAADGRVAKYAVAHVTREAAEAGGHILRCLAAMGTVMRPVDAVARSALVDQRLVLVDEPDREELEWYRSSVTASRTATILNDPILRCTRLVEAVGSSARGSIPLPTVSVILASRRPGDLARLVPTLAPQTYPAIELVVATHGYELDEAEVDRLEETVPFPVRVYAYEPTVAFGQLLGHLSQRCDGELITKMDDDDLYGRDHVTDLVVGRRSSGADLVGKGARFTFLPDLDVTIDRRWAAPEVDNVYVAGGTLMLSRGTLQEVGGWSTAEKHVDTHLAWRIGRLGGVVHRIHSLDYVYVRKRQGHTWQTDIEDVLSQAQAQFSGIPTALLVR
jgi:hypothetical protein